MRKMKQTRNIENFYRLKEKEKYTPNLPSILRGEKIDTFPLRENEAKMFPPLHPVDPLM